ncbi:hypothetical protein KEM52_005994 [Ascosphaera acerosa]|nr:hypothetical protein KEM52_005994 [Ascosphaera acerosa]
MEGLEMEEPLRSPAQESQQQTASERESGTTSEKDGQDQGIAPAALTGASATPLLSPSQIIRNQDGTPGSIAGFQAFECQDIDQMKMELFRYAESRGFAVAVRRPSQKNPHTGRYCRYDVECTMGRSSPSKSRGIRNRRPTRCGCPWQGKLVCKNRRSTWKFAIMNDQHNHPAIDDPAKLPISRRRRKGDHDETSGATSDAAVSVGDAAAGRSGSAITSQRGCVTDTEMILHALQAIERRFTRIEQHLGIASEDRIVPQTQPAASTTRSSPTAERPSTGTGATSAADFIHESLEASGAESKRPSVPSGGAAAKTVAEAEGVNTTDPLLDRSQQQLTPLTSSLPATATLSLAASTAAATRPAQELHFVMHYDEAGGANARARDDRRAAQKQRQHIIPPLSELDQSNAFESLGVPATSSMASDGLLGQAMPGAATLFSQQALQSDLSAQVPQVDASASMFSPTAQPLAGTQRPLSPAIAQQLPQASTRAPTTVSLQWSQVRTPEQIRTGQTGKSRCLNCHETGHNRRNCPNASGESVF